MSMNLHFVLEHPLRLIRDLEMERRRPVKGRILLTSFMRFLAVAVTALVVLASCGGDDPALEGPTYDDADIAFLQGMLPHHQEAIEMAELVADRTDRPELNDLADDIIASQSEEIDKIETMLRESGEEVPAEDAGMDMGEEEPMGGMSEEEMKALMDAGGEDFDRMFTRMMIQHHQEAVQMANDVLTEGQHPDVAELAQAIIDEQQAEIDKMMAWRDEWGI